MADALLEIEIPEQKLLTNGVRFPAAVSPPATASTVPLPQTIKTHKHFLESLLLQSGAVLLRGFPIQTASDFNDVVEAFNYEEFPYVGGAAPRTNVIGRVFTANESPPDQKIPFHHEMAHVPQFPSKLFFFCEVEPDTGGETPIVLSHVIYDRMKHSYPDFVDRLEKYGLCYVNFFGENDNPSSPIGRGWKSIFLTDDKTIAQQRAANLGMKLEWLEDGGVKTIMGPIPAVKYDKKRKRKIWFNSMVVAYTGSEDDTYDDPVNAVTFGDGQPLPAHVIYDCLKIMEEESVAIPWRKGDVILLDNWTVLHSRRPSESDPPRRVLASLVK